MNARTEITSAGRAAIRDEWRRELQLHVDDAAVSVRYWSPAYSRSFAGFSVSGETAEIVAYLHELRRAIDDALELVYRVPSTDGNGGDG